MGEAYKRYKRGEPLQMISPLTDPTSARPRVRVELRYPSGLPEPEAHAIQHLRLARLHLGECVAILPDDERMTFVEAQTEAIEALEHKAQYHAELARKYGHLDWMQGHKSAAVRCRAAAAVLSLLLPEEEE